jgi:hypothetical protein
MRFINLVGQRFGRLTVIVRVENGACNRTRWLCRCDCGSEVIVFGCGLKSGNTKSCGCYKHDRIIETKTTHGMKGTPLYGVWKDIKNRCYNANGKDYNLYGARGIRVCDRWLNSFENFYKDMKEGYYKGLTIERVNTNCDYEPDNCKWATNTEQQNNKRNNHLITYNGKTQTMKQWADELGIRYYVLKDRITKRHWPIERAFTQSVRKSPVNP